MAMSDFGMRGMSCLTDSMRTSAAWLLSFNKTSTIPALKYIDTYYDADVANSKIGVGAVSTEHSVMGANYALDGDEITFVKKLLTELYPNTSFSMVSDTYDYWNMIDNILPACKEEIMNHNGKLLVRPDSGDIVDISVTTVEKLWDLFGGTVNEKGYKVLDPHIGIIYGDGCTLAAVEKIWTELEQKGFAANNIVFGVGAFCFHGFFEDGRLIVLTRDTFGIAMKAAYGEFGDEKLFIYKDPKTDTNKLKKSHKGCCAVTRNEDGTFTCADEHYGLVPEDETELKTVFCDGIDYTTDTFVDIRRRVNDYRA
jgi:nicotinamide phosphoribosyltransferase